MEKAYRNIIIISLLLSAVCLAMLGDNFLSTNLVRSALAYILYGSIFTVLFSLVIGTSYYVVRKRNAYLGIITFSVLLTTFLFSMDYLVWDVSATPLKASRVIFEVLVYGSMYVGIFFGAFSGIYYGLLHGYKLVATRIK